METEQGVTFTTPPPPPPPPPPRETEEASEILVKVEEEDESMQDVKPHIIDSMGPSVSPSDLKRKREERDEDAVMDEEFPEMTKKMKGTENGSSPKINGIHKSEDLKTVDAMEKGLNWAMAKKAF